MWRAESFRVSLPSMGTQATESENPYQAYLNSMFDNGVAIRLNHTPEEVFIAPVYNEEETEVVNEVSGMIWETSNEWRTLFVTGAKDIDAAYLSDLDALGLAEYTAASQSCYDRMITK